MANEKIGRIRRVGQQKSFPTRWDFELSRAEEVASIEGVGRTGAPLRSLDIPGVSHKSEAQIKSLGLARVRITRSGGKS